MFAKTGDEFATHFNGKEVELLDGENTITMEKGWGYFDIDYLEFVPVKTAYELQKPPKKLADRHATPAACALLHELVEQYGAKTFSGQYRQEDCAYVREHTGQTPAIIGGDFMDYSPSRVAFNPAPKDLTERMIQSAKAGQIVTMSWHWNAPKDLLDTVKTNDKGEETDLRWWKGFNTNATTFDVEKALADSDSDDYRALLRDIDAIAVQLQKFADADIPVLWRPLHEADGGWFWWGAKEGPRRTSNCGD